MSVENEKKVKRIAAAALLIVAPLAAKWASEQKVEPSCAVLIAPSACFDKTPDLSFLKPKPLSTPTPRER